MYGDNITVEYCSNNLKSFSVKGIFQIREGQLLFLFSSRDFIRMEKYMVVSIKKAGALYSGKYRVLNYTNVGDYYYIVYLAEKPSLNIESYLNYASYEAVMEYETFENPYKVKLYETDKWFSTEYTTIVYTKKFIYYNGLDKKGNKVEGYIKSPYSGFKNGDLPNVFVRGICGIYSDREYKNIIGMNEDLSYLYSTVYAETSILDKDWKIEGKESEQKWS